MSVNNYFGTPGSISIGGLTQSEIDQISNIGANIISTTTWSYLANINQSVGTLGSPSFLRILTGDGTSLLPSLTFLSDPDTGIYHGANANEVAISTQGTIRALFADSTTTIKNILTLENDFRIGAGPYVFSSKFDGTGSYCTSNLSIGHSTITANALDVIGDARVDGQIVCTNGYQCTTVGTFLTAVHGVFDNVSIGQSPGVNALNCTGTGSISTLKTSRILAVDGYNNSLIGLNSGNDLTDGTHNICVGGDAGTNITTGDFNICIGRLSKTQGVDTQYALCLGYGAVATDYSTSIGYAAGTGATSTTTNTTNRLLIGYQVGNSNTSLIRSAIIGNGSLSTGAGTGGWDHAILGHQCAIANQSAVGLSLVGYQAGTSITTGGYNTCFGYKAGDIITSGTYNICIGSDSDTHADNNIYTIIMGYLAKSTSGSISIGYRAGNAAAGTTSITSDSKVLIGTSVGNSNTDLIGSAIVGGQACASGVGTGGNYHSMLGYKCGFVNQSAVGLTLVGYKCGVLITTGGFNCCFGYQAGDNITSGINNICIGKDAQPAAATSDNSISIGAGASAATNAVVIGNASTTANTLYGTLSVPVLKSTGIATTATMTGYTALVVDNTTGEIKKYIP